LDSPVTFPTAWIEKDDVRLGVRDDANRIVGGSCFFYPGDARDIS
jgi:hypothetical protein